MPLDERHQANFDHPDSIDSELLMNHIKRLKGRTSRSKCRFMISNLTREAIETEHIEPKPVVIVEGILDICGIACVKPYSMSGFLLTRRTIFVLFAV